MKMVKIYEGFWKLFCPQPVQVMWLTAQKAGSFNLTKSGQVIGNFLDFQDAVRYCEVMFRDGD